ncbi:nitrate/sulfonate/bicarbonate ABC transporter periplasmic protein [Klebsiella pneumoniae]|uniref:Putative aliphatic sulfonates-binding protein n=1 Tax=Klebsiella pneumoniae TaxID=573 RepID=A0A4P0Y882_KLEPN|nr:nitrate/sulfonate/bicarbonate ABC transporter periplasmic protein [Klebsiella pneumoniae]
MDKSNPAGTAVLVSPGSTLKSGADLKGKRIATGKGSIGHFVALKALEQAGISPKEVQWVFLGPVDAKVALLNGSVDAWATWEPYTTQMVKTNEGQILVSGKGLLPGNTFLAATDSALNDPHKRAALQDYLQRLAGAERWAYANLDSYGKTLGRSSASRRKSPARSLPTASRSGSRWPRKRWPSSRQRRTFISPTA